MKKRFKVVLIMSIISSFLLTSCKEIKEYEKNPWILDTEGILIVMDEIKNANLIRPSEVQIQIEEEQEIESMENLPEEQGIESLPKEEEKIIEIETEISPLPESILNEISYQKSRYPGISIGVGIYSLDGKQGYEYNEEQVISGGCTIKAPYALYVLQQCDEQDIDIDKETLVYQVGMRNNGSGIIKNNKYGTSYTIAYLLEKLLDISDNTAYNILVSRFPLSQYQEFLDNIDGQELNGRQYGAASVLQRKNEWLTIYNYLNSGEKYSEILRNYVTNTQFCYIVEWMKGEHTYMHKSGWSYGSSYTSASDCAIIDENYLLIILTQDYSTGVAHTDVVQSIGLRVEEYADSLGGNIFN